MTPDHAHCDQLTSVRRTVARLLLTLGAIVVTAGHAFAATLSTTEIGLPVTSASETTPILGADSSSRIVVYTSRDLSSGLPNGQIFYQRISEGGIINIPVPVSEGGADDQLNDISGDLIVYSSYINTTSDTGRILLYEISSGLTQPISDLTTIFEARIQGHFVAWVEGTPGATRVMLQDLNGLPFGQRPIQLSGPTPPGADVEIGDMLVVWRERSGLQDDVVAYDRRTGTRVNVASDPLVNERAPATAGPWVVWNASGGSIVGREVHAFNVDTGERRVIAQNGASSDSPRIDGDIISYGSNVSGNFEIYLHRVSTGETFQATMHPADQLLNDVFGNMVAYVDKRNGNSDVFVTVFRFVLHGEINVTPYPTVQFGNVEVGTSRSAIVTISNLSPQQILTVSGIQFGSAAGRDFMITQAPLFPVQIPANGSVDVGITFTPSSQGDNTVGLQIASDDPDENLVQVTLHGTGVRTQPTPADQIQDILNFIDGALTNGTLAGSGSGNSAANRAKVMGNMILAAGDLVTQGQIAEACQQLQDALKKTDGVPNPPDFVSGPAAAELATRIQSLRASLGCP